MYEVIGLNPPIRWTEVNSGVRVTGSNSVERGRIRIRVGGHGIGRSRRSARPDEIWVSVTVNVYDVPVVSPPRIIEL